MSLCESPANSLAEVKWRERYNPLRLRAQLFIAAKIETMTNRVLLGDATEMHTRFKTRTDDQIQRLADRIKRSPPQPQQQPKGRCRGGVRRTAEGCGESE